MRKFLLNIIIFLFILVSITVVINNVYINRDNSDSRHTDKFKSIPGNIRICNFGSSHGKLGFNYVDYSDDLTCFNFALGSQRLSYDTRLLKYYKDLIEPNGVVYIVVSHHSFFGVPEEQEEQFKAKNVRYYDILPKELIKDYSRKEAFLIKFPVLTGYLSIFNTLAGKSINIEEEKWASETAERIDIGQSAYSAYSSYIKQQQFDEKGNRIFNQEEIKAINEMINICESIGAEPILVTTPFLEEYNKYVHELSPDFYVDFYGLIDEIVDNKHVLYLDYSEDERFSDSYSLFMNADLLNKEGARKFTDILIKETIGYIK